MNKFILILCLFPLLITSCMEDKGNYSYEDINRITIGNVEKMHSVLQFDSPGIVPDIKQTFSKDETNLTYLWALEREDESVKDSLCTHRNFDVTVSLAPNIYRVAYYVVDKNTGVFTKQMFTLEVKSVLGEGLLVLSDLHGQANLAYIYEKKVIQDIESGIPGGLGKNPVGVYYHSKSANTPAYVSVMCKDENGGTMLDAVGLNKVMAYKDFFAIPLSNPNPQGYIHSRYGYKYLASKMYYYCSDLNYEFICDGGKVHERYRYGSRTKMNVPYVSSDDKGYEASPYMLADDVGGVIYIYDQKNHRFMQKDNNSGSNILRPVTTWAGSNVFDPLKVGDNMELLHADVGYVNSTKGPLYYLVFKDGAKYYCVQAWIYFSGFYLLMASKTELTIPIDEHTCFGVHLKTPSLYYSKGDEIYNVDVEIGTTELRWSSKGKKITCIKAEPYIRREDDGYYVYDHMRLYVGVSGDAVNGKTGSVYVLKANNDNSLEEIAHYDNISGDIKSFVWKR